MEKRKQLLFFCNASGSGGDAWGRGKPVCMHAPEFGVTQTVAVSILLLMGRYWPGAVSHQMGMPLFNAQVNRCRSAQGANIGHENGEAIACVGVRVELTVKPRPLHDWLFTLLGRKCLLRSSRSRYRPLERLGRFEPSHQRCMPVRSMAC